MDATTTRSTRRAPECSDTEPPPPASPIPRGRVVVVTTVVAAGLACLAALLLAGGAPRPNPAGLADPGPVVGWGLRATRLATLLSGVMVVGSLLVAAVLVPGDRDVRRRAGRLASRAAALWSAAGAAGFVLTVCDTAGVPLRDVDAGLLLLWGASGPAAAYLVVALVVGSVSVASARVDTARGAGLLLLLALAAALPVAVAGHGTEDGTLGALVVHVVAALLWTGGLAGLVLHVRRDRGALATAVPRFSALALGAFVSLGVSGVLVALAGLPLSGVGVWAAWTSGYAAVLGVKVATLLVLGTLGQLHRRRTLPRVVAGAPAAFLRLATVELLLMGVALGLASALSRTPLPPVPPGGAGHGETGELAELTLSSLATAWRPDAIVLVLLGAALAAYLAGVRAVQRRGGAWPRRRTLWFTAGLGLALLDLCSGVAAYAPVLLSVHLSQLLVALVLVPLLVLLGRPVTLAVAAGAASPPEGLVRALANPATGAVLACVLVTGLHRTALIGLSLSSPWWHLLVLLAAVGCGLVLLWPVLGTDTVPEPRSRGERAGWLATVAGCLVVLGAQLRLSDQLLAADWFLELRLGWSEPVPDQRVAGWVALLGAAALLVLALGGARRSTLRRR